MNILGQEITTIEIIVHAECPVTDREFSSDGKLTPQVRQRIIQAVSAALGRYSGISVRDVRALKPEEKA